MININNCCHRTIRYGLCAVLAGILLFKSDFAHGQYNTPAFFPVAPEAISDSFVRCFQKDKMGYMWMGTADGLIKYDGTNSTRYEHSPTDKTSIRHNQINALVEDPSGRLWIGTAQGLCIYNREKDDFINVDSIPGNKNHLNGRYITALSFDGQGKLWIGSYGGGITVYDPVGKEFIYLGLPSLDGKKSPAINYVNTLLVQGDLMWCGTKGGLQLFKTQEMVPLSLIHLNDHLKNPQISQLSQDKEGNIWMITVSGEVLRIVKGDNSYSFETVFSGKNVFGSSWNNIVTFSPDSDGNFWIAGENSGLNYLNTKTRTVIQYLAEQGNPERLPTNSIRSVYVDETGLTWLGTYNKGAYLIDRKLKKFQSPGRNEFRGLDVRGFVEDKEGNIWITVQGIGLQKLEAKTGVLVEMGKINRKLSNKYLTDLIFDKDGFLWVGTIGDGLIRINLSTDDLHYYNIKSNGFGDNRIECLYQDKNGLIWAGTNGSGLFYFNDRKGQFDLLCEETKPDFLTKTSYISSMAEDSDGIFWVGTMFGLYALTKENDNYGFTYHCYLQNETPGSISSNNIQTVFEDSNKNLWIGTTDNGLNVKFYGQDGFKVFQKKQGLGSNTVRGILVDKSGNLWVSGNMGLTRFDPKENTFVSYARKDGLVSNNFYGNASLRSSSGELFFGSNNGFNSFYPDSIGKDNEKPVVRLTGIKISNELMRIDSVNSPLKKNISLTSEVDLTYNQRSFMIDFAAIGYGDSFTPSYCYKLEGFDDSWNCIGSNHTATYTTLSPGQYVFLAKAANGDGIWSDVPARLVITVHPALWNTWWAKVLYGISVSGLALYLIQVRADRVKMKNQLELERMAHERARELSESKTRFFTNISHEFRTPLSLIQMPLESLLAEKNLSDPVKQKVLTINRSADKMMLLISELMDFNKLESGNMKLRLQEGELVKFITETAILFNDVAARRNITFTIKSLVPSLRGWVDMNMLEKILVNILSNAFKFTSIGGRIDVVINSRSSLAGDDGALHNCLELTIIDNGIGISADEILKIFDKFYQARSAEKINNPGTGIGLSLTKGLVEFHKGSVHASSTPNRETKFTIIIPIDLLGESIKTSDALDPNIDADIPEEIYEVPLLGKSHVESRKSEILIVEDNDELRTYLASELKEEFNILEAVDGEGGLEIAIDSNPDLIISDVLMEKKSGIELCKALKSNLKTSHIPVMLLTAKASLEDQITGIEAGADVYITKPFSVRFLITHVKNLITSRQKLFARFSQEAYLIPEKISSNEIDQVFLERAIEYIVNNMQNRQLGVDAIATLFNLSRVQIYRKIKALTGKTVVEFIRMVRLKQALKLMETHRYRLSEVATKTGFNSASYFTRSFKEEFGKPPSEIVG